MSGHSTHTTYDSSSGGEEGGAAEEPVARERWVESGVGKWLELQRRAIEVLCPTKYYFAVHDRESFVGKVDEAGRNLVQVAYKCLMKGIDIGR